MSDVTSRSGTWGHLLLPGSIAFVGFTILVCLGVWQLVRSVEKGFFIEKLTMQAAGAPAAMPDTATWPQLDPARLNLTRVQARGAFIDGPFATVRTTIASGGPGTRQLSGFGRWIFQGFRLEDGGVVLVNRGFVPESRLGQISPATGPAIITGYLRAPETRGSFTPADLPARREFYTRDPTGIAASLGIGPVAAFYLEAERVGDGMTPPAGVDANELIGRIPDNHLSYALTWFGLALTLMGVFGAWAWQGRKPASAV